MLITKLKKIIFNKDAVMALPSSSHPSDKHGTGKDGAGDRVNCRVCGMSSLDGKLNKISS